MSISDLIRKTRDILEASAVRESQVVMVDLLYL